MPAVLVPAGLQRLARLNTQPAERCAHRGGALSPLHACDAFILKGCWKISVVSAAFPLVEPFTPIPPSLNIGMQGKVLHE